jgi:2-dehydro-3-deoxy-D-arabinonate dehydratase
MQIMKFAMNADRIPHVGVVQGDELVEIDRGESSLTDLLHSLDPAGKIRGLLASSKRTFPIHSVRVLAPLDEQEVWGAGVTYERSKVAREQESDQAATFYDLVYRADRPELFFKATPSRVVGPGQPIRVRRDSNWCVPEPELALVLSPALELVGFTAGNDLSARDIEGENPLYLPQAKVYDSCCSLGPSITLTEAMPPRASIGIRMAIERDGTEVYEGGTSVARMARRFEELIDWLGRENRFPSGVILLTGTGIVPPDDFSLRAGDLVRIAIDGIGTLANPVIQGAIA